MHLTAQFSSADALCRQKNVEVQLLKQRIHCDETLFHRHAKNRPEVVTDYGQFLGIIY
jgi:hypothetical protein